jgi:nitroreductase
MPVREVVERILAAAVLAPSADNSQPWRFAVHDDTVSLWVDPSRADSISDVDRVLTHTACGAAIENIVIQAAALGYETDVALFPQPCPPDLVARLTWRPGPVRWTELAQAIPARHTNRKLYQHRPIEGSVLKALADTGQAFPGVALRWLTRQAGKASALRLMRHAEGERFLRRALHAELFSKVRFDVGWERPVDEGLPPGALEVEWPARPLFRLLRHWPVMRALARLGLHRVLGWRVADLPTRLAPAFGVVSVASTSGESTVVGVRALQRIWLEATVRGIAMQPLAAGTILPRQLGWPGSPIPQRTLGTMARLLSSVTLGRPGLVFLRAGYAPPSRVRASRRPLETFIRDVS